MAKVGTLERTSPLPGGQYWIDVFGVNIPKADNWFKAYSGLGVHVDSTETFPNDDSARVRNWYKFTYTPIPSIPVIWDTSLGFPTVADSSITSSSDTAQTPPLPLDPLDELANWVNSVEQKVGGSLGSIASLIPFALLGGAGYLGYKLVTDFSSVKKRAKKYVKRSSRA